MLKTNRKNRAVALVLALAVLGLTALLLCLAAESPSAKRGSTGQAWAALMPQLSRRPVRAGEWPSLIRSAFRHRAGYATRQYPLTEKNLTPNTPLSNERQPAWSVADQIVFSSNGEDSDNNGTLDALNADYDLWTMDREGRFLKRVADIDGDQTDPCWSPDGGQVCYISDESGSTQLYRRRMTDLTPTKLTDVPPLIDKSTKMQPFWSPAGSEIYYASNGDPKGTNADGGFEIFAIGVDGVLIRQVTNSPAADNTNPTVYVFPSGLHVLAFTSTRSGNRRIWTMNALTSLEASPPAMYSNPPDSTAQDDDADFDLNGARLTFSSTRPTSGADLVPDFGVWAAPYGGVGSVETGSILVSNTAVNDSAADVGPTYSRNNNPTLLENLLAFTSARTGSDDIWRANTLDSIPPTLEDGFPQDLSGQPFVRVTPRTPRVGLFAGSTATIECVVSDVESGIATGAAAGSVVIEINNPNWDRSLAENDPHFFLVPANPNASINIIAAQERQYQGNRPYFTDTSDEFALVDKITMDVWDDGPVSAGGHEQQPGAAAGDQFYYCTASYTTPTTQRDYYLDLLVQDLAGNDFEYDNIWGFSTEPFSPVPPILVVSDYMAGQKWVNDVLFGHAQPGGLPTEFEFGVPCESHLIWNPGGSPYLGVDQSLGFFPQFGAVMRDSIKDSLGEDYALWRVQCRGRIPTDVYTAYLPREEQQVDPANPGTFKTVTVAEKALIWENPYTGSLRVGPGSLIDSRAQQDLTSFLDKGGRLVISGQDIGWALTNNGVEQNTFYNQYLRAASFQSNAADIAGRNPGASNFPTRVAMSPRNPITDHPYGFWPPPGQEDPTELHYPIGTSSQPRWDDCAWNINWWASSITPQGATPVLQYAGTNTTAGVLIDNTGGGATVGSRIVYFAFDLASVNREYDNRSPGARCINYRGKLIHNSVCWARSGFVWGQVVDVETNEPLSDIQINIGTVASGFTKSDGRYEIHGVPPGAYGVTIGTPGYFEHPGAGVTVHGGLQTGTTNNWNFRLTVAPPGSISGMVFASDGVTPIGAGVTVTAQPLAVDPQGNRLPSTSTTTAADGSYQIPQIPAGDYDVTANPDGSAIGYDSVTQNNVKVSPGSDTPNINFTLGSQPSSISGRVTELGTGTPISGASVKAEYQGSALGTATTDANGDYTISNLQAGDYVVTGNADGYSPASESVTLVAGQSATVGLQLQAQPPGSISGVVSSATTGEALAGVVVKVINSSGTEVARTTTGASIVTEGSLRFNFAFRPPANPIGSGSYTVEFDGSSQGFGTAQRSVTVASNQETSGVDVALNALRSFAAGLHMFSVPFDFGGTDAAAVLGVQSPKLATWNTLTADWAFYPNPPATQFSLGRGYFALFAATTDLTRAGTAAPTAQRYAIPVFDGWNLIGDPFNYEVDWLSTRVRTSTGSEIPLSDAQSSGIVGTGLFTLPTVLSSSSGFTGYNLATRLSPFGGYWVQAGQNATLLIDSTRVRSRATTRAVSPSAVVGSDGWAIQLIARSGDAQDAANYAGVSSRARDAQDPMDMADPPPVSFVPYVSLSFVPEPSRADSERLAVDLRSAVATEKQWTFEVISNQSAPVTLSWPDLSELPKQYRAYLVDPESGRRQSMRTAVSYTYRNVPGVPRRLQMTVTTAASGALRVTGLRQVPSRGAGGSVSFTLSQPARLAFRVVASNGRVVFQRDAGEMSAGLNQLHWNGRDQAGKLAPRGAYVVQIAATEADTGGAYRAIGTLVVR